MEGREYRLVFPGEVKPIAALDRFGYLTKIGIVAVALFGVQLVGIGKGGAAADVVAEVKAAVLTSSYFVYRVGSRGDGLRLKGFHVKGRWHFSRDDSDKVIKH